MRHGLGSGLGHADGAGKLTVGGGGGSPGPNDLTLNGTPLTLNGVQLTLG